MDAVYTAELSSPSLHYAEPQSVFSVSSPAPAQKSDVILKDFIPHDHSLAKPSMMALSGSGNAVGQGAAKRGKAAGGGTNSFDMAETRMGGNPRERGVGGICMKPARSNARKLPAVKEFSKNVLAPTVAEVDVGRPCLQCGKCSTGFRKHEWRHGCVTCQCPRYNHDVLLKGHVTVAEKMGEPWTQQLQADKDRARHWGYAWVPHGLTTEKEVKQYFGSLPEQAVPSLDGVGNRERDRQLVLQLPTPDFFHTQCLSLAPMGGHENYHEMRKYREEQAFGVGTVKHLTSDKAGQNCQKCEKRLARGDFAVTSDKFDPGVMWHPLCFCCTLCDLPLVDLCFFWWRGFIYCGRHWMEQLRPRCATCDEIIYCNEVTQGGMNNQQNHHPGHYVCEACSVTLSGKRYILREEQSFCVKCYEDRFANSCQSCSSKIGTDSKDLSYEDKHWHERCFVCTQCKEPLVEKMFGFMGDKLYCDTCYENLFGIKCDACGLPFRAGMKKLEWAELQWHEECFKCTNCQTAIGCNTFMPNDSHPYCVLCFNSLFAPKCSNCSKAILTGGVLYRSEPFHRECFCCANCSKNLMHEKFTSRDDKPYCAQCFAELFARKCTTCSKPITGIGGSKFISFDGRDWHNECFNCSGVDCGGINLVGKGFVTDKDRILCPDCAELPFSKRDSQLSSPSPKNNNNNTNNSTSNDMTPTSTVLSPQKLETATPHQAITSN